MDIVNRNIDWSKADALIFDMDGTLWDAVDSYCKIWIECFRRFGIEREVSRDDLISLMGKPLIDIYHCVAGRRPQVPAEQFMPMLEQLEIEMMPGLGGTPYDGVVEGIERLSQAYPIFLLSNCGADGLNNMMRHIGITDYVTEAVTFGETRLQKDENIRRIMERHSLRQPVYVGDTQSDCTSTHRAQVPFAFASYGFGTCDCPDIVFDTFSELTDFFKSIKQ
ncbi:MAG: HAD family hydrolase [Bacteroidales bacterium]|nr:HAD family hydrolase [Bacteroidales bacterium]